MTREIFDRGRPEERIPVPEHTPSREEDFWPDSFWSNTENRYNNPTLIAARHLARRGFGITFERPFDLNDGPLDSSQIAIHVATFDDRKALNALTDSEEIRNLRRSVSTGASDGHIANQMTWYQNAERVIEQAIEQKGLKPKLKLMARLKRRLKRQM